MFNSLQACRALAALLVVLHHANHGIFRLDKYFGHKPIGLLVEFAPAAIDFFFVLSGFIIMYAHGKDIGKPHALTGYLWRRFSRVYLFYWVVLAAVIPVFFLVPRFGFGFERDPDVIVRSILLVPHPQTHLVLGVAWTLVYEILFYVLFGVMVLNRRIGVAIFFLWAAGCISFPWLYSAAADLAGTHVYIYRFLCSDMHLRFLAGMLACVVLQRWRIPAPRRVATVGAILFLTTGAFDNYYGPLPQLNNIVCYTLGSVLVVLGLAEADRQNLIRTPSWLEYLGNATYAIYLVHFLALSVMAKIAKASGLDQYMPSLVLFFLHVVGAVAAGCLCHHLLEHPLHQWAKRYFRRPQPAAPVSATTEVEPSVRRAA